MSNEEQRTQEQADEQKPVHDPSKELEEAVARVYRQYGPDLSKFVRDVQRDIQKRAADGSGACRRLTV